MSDQLKKLNLYLSQGKVLEFNETLNNLKNLNQISEEKYFKYLGFFHLQNNNFNLAEENLLKAVSFNKNSFDNYLNLGVCYLKQDKNQLSVENFEKALKLKDDFLDTYILYSRALRNMSLDDKAIEILKQGLLKIKKNNLKIHLELAEIYREKREFLLAITNYNFLIKNNPNNYILLNSIAVCYESIGEIGMAESNYKKALKIKPDFFEAIANYGNLFRARGDNDNALKLFEQCLKLDQPKSKIYRYISIFHKFKSDKDVFLKNMIEYQNSKMAEKDTDIEELYFAISKAYEDIKDTKNFGKYLHLANNEKHKKISSLKFKKEVEFFDIVKSTFSKEFSESVVPESSGDRIILVMGMPRSGTTLVEQILGSHDEVKAGGEQVFFQNILKKFFNFYDHQKFKTDVVEKLKTHKKEIANQYLNQLKTIDKTKIVTDKLPFNFFYVGFFLAIYKNIKIINVVRDPMDNCFSIYKNFFPEEINFAYNQKDLSEYYLNYYDLIKYWEKIYSNKIFNLNYENLISKPEDEVKKLLSFCNLKWDENCLRFYENKNTVNTLSSFQVRNPIYSSSIKSWVKYKDYLKILEKNLPQDKFCL